MALFCCLILSLGLATPPAHAESFSIQNAATQLSNGVYQLGARIEYDFTDEVLTALTNGVPLTLRLDIEVQRERRWWIDTTVASLEQRFQLTYHAFSDQYLLRNLNSGALYTYPTLGLALDAAGHVRALPLLDARFIEGDAQYQVQLRAALDIESLPAPLRPVAYITPAWRLSSDWYTCSLTP